MSKKQPWFIGMRAEAFAVILLTERSDLTIKSREPAESGLNLLVEITRDGRATNRLIGIDVKATVAPLSPKEVRRLFSLALADRKKEGASYPVCSFLFDVKENQSLYAWLLEPVLTEQDKPRLEVVKAPEAAKLGREAIDAIADRVNRWYDALTALLTA